MPLFGAAPTAGVTGRDYRAAMHRAEFAISEACLGKESTCNACPRVWNGFSSLPVVELTVACAIGHQRKALQAALDTPQLHGRTYT